VIGQVHVVSIHVRDQAAFDSVFLFLQDVLQLPRVYGEPSKPENKEQRLYAGFSVGNAYLEPCGPYSNDAPFSSNCPARFVGLTFSPGRSLADSAVELGLRNFEHSDVLGGGGLPKFVFLYDSLLTSKRQAVSLWEIQNTNDSVNLGFLSDSLQKTKGGALGVKRLQEVWIGYPGEANLAAWNKFLRPCRRESDIWLVGNGPALRLVPSKESQLESIVLQVGSMARAKTALAEKNLVGKLALDAIELDVAKTFGLRIVLQEK